MFFVKGEIAMKHRMPLGICLLGCFVFVVTYQLANVFAKGTCNQYCRQYSHFCETDGNKNCKANKCFFYYNAPEITDYAYNCYPCGDGPLKGWCLNDDDDKDYECLKTAVPVDWKFTASCDPECDPSYANTYVEATAGGKIVGNGSGSLYECFLKKKPTNE
jgi:hypothetical protein